MAFGGKVNHRIRAHLIEQMTNSRLVTNIGFEEPVVRIPSTGRRELRFPAYVNLSTLTTSAPISLTRCRHTAEPIKPAPPVTIMRIRCFLNLVKILTAQQILKKALLPPWQAYVGPAAARTRIGTISHTQRSPAYHIIAGASDLFLKVRQNHYQPATVYLDPDRSRPHRHRGLGYKTR